MTDAASRRARARQRLKEERFRLLLKRWDRIVKSLLWDIAEATWLRRKQQAIFRRKAGQQSGVFGIHWEACAHGKGGRTRSQSEERTYYRITLMTNKDFIAQLFIVECRDKIGLKNQRIVVGISAENLEQALLEARHTGPAVLHQDAFEEWESEWSS